MEAQELLKLKSCNNSLEYQEISMIRCSMGLEIDNYMGGYSEDLTSFVKFMRCYTVPVISSFFVSP